MAENITRKLTGVGTLTLTVNPGQTNLIVNAAGNTFSVVGYCQPVADPDRVSAEIFESGAVDVNGTILKGFTEIDIIVSAGAAELKAVAIPVAN